MEEHEEQELEFWRKLHERDLSRAQMLKRSVAAAAGLTVLSSPGLAWARGRGIRVTPPLKGKGFSMKELIAEAKKEGKLNVIALPHDWANYGQIISTFKSKYGLAMDEQNPDGSSAQENQAVQSLQGDPRAPDVVDDAPAFAISGTAQGLFGKYFVSEFSTIPRNMKDTRGYWTGDYWGAISIGYNGNLVKTPPRTFQDLLHNPHDEDLFDYYAASQLLIVDSRTGQATPVGKPALFGSVQVSPDGKHFLVERTHRPYSYLLPAFAFPKEVEVWDRAGKVEYTLASLPSEEHVPIEGVPTGPRDYEWLPTQPATLVWAEALDNGDTRAKVPYHDHLMMLVSPFQDQPKELARLEQRFRNLAWGEKADYVLPHAA